MADPTPVIDDLRAESDELDLMVAESGPEQWALPTSAPGWTVAHQIAHLAWTDRSALLAVTDTGAFQALVEKALAALDSFVDEGGGGGRRAPARRPAGGLAHRAHRPGRGPARRPARRPLPWYGPPMSVASMATARLMETWAHAGTSPTPWVWSAHPPTGSGMWPGSGCGPGTSPTGCTDSPRRPTSSASN